jgi:hypothetical protein
LPQIEVKVNYGARPFKREVVTVQIDRFCFCKRDLMSVCTAGSVDEQKKCRFYQKSSYSDKCMFFIFDRYCDCLDAQMNMEEPDVPEIL